VKSSLQSNLSLLQMLVKMDGWRDEGMEGWTNGWMVAVRPSGLSVSKLENKLLQVGGAGDYRSPTTAGSGWLQNGECRSPNTIARVAGQGSTDLPSTAGVT